MRMGGFRSVWGASILAGGDAWSLFTCFDYVTARNQPSIGGSEVGNGEVEHRFNINFGYYF
jgi:hypothetical protein